MPLEIMAEEDKVPTYGVSFHLTCDHPHVLSLGHVRGMHICCREPAIYHSAVGVGQ